MTDIEFVVLQKAIVFGLIVGVGSLSFLVTLLLGPAREYVKSGMALIDDEDLEFTLSDGRKLRRPNRKDLRDPVKAPQALQSYRERAKRVIQNSRARYNAVFQQSLSRALTIVAITLGASTFAFISFIATNNYLFGMGDAISGTQSGPVPLLLLTLVAHFKSAFGFTLSGPEISTLQLGGFFTSTASAAYKLVLAWAAPVSTQQLKWLFYDLELIWKNSIRDLQRIVMSSDEQLMMELEDYIAENKTANAGGWITSIWQKAWGRNRNSSSTPENYDLSFGELDSHQELRRAA
jgi:hypothetical protein